MSQGRILVVDDLPDVCSTICGILEDAGYITFSASSREDALHRLDIERYHLAVLDIRLDESDEDDQEGLALMRDIAEKYPSMAIIILTGYPTMERIREALQPDRDDMALAFGFLTKPEMVKLPEYVERAFHARIKLNEKLIIDDPESCIEGLAFGIRFRAIRRPDQDNLVDEIREIFERLFFDCEKIVLYPMQQGFGGAAVFQVIPWYQEKGRGESLVVKVGEIISIQNEKQNYNRIKGIVGGYRIPTAIEIAKTQRLGGLLYTFAGMGHVVDFVHFYDVTPVETIMPILDNLYLNTCFPWRHEQRIQVRNYDLKEFYTQHLNLTSIKYKTIADQMNNSSFQHDPLKKEYWLNDSIIVNPLLFALDEDFYCESCFTTIHGDLTCENVLVDQHEETWLIDFAATTNNGHILQDYASLENFIRLLLIKTDDISLLYEWEKSLFSNNMLADKIENRFSSIKEIAKAQQIIQKIRDLARKTNHYSNRAYLISLFFNVLRSTTFLDLPRFIIDHGLLSASIIADRLLKGNTDG